MSTNLSELSVQLRKLQSEKTAQANEIDRLQRQVRILLDLKGIGITDLQDALRAACDDEAHGELRALVGKLQARVDGLELSGGGGVGHRRRVHDHDISNTIPTHDQFNEEAARNARTALELRIGELEEIETNLRTECLGLYQHSQELTERNTLLETQVIQQKALLDQWEHRWRIKEEEERKRSSIVPIDTSSGSYNYSEFATTTNNNSQPILLSNMPQSQIDAGQQLIAAETALAGEKKQRTLVEGQLLSAQKTHDLKADQYKYRIQFLEEQLNDIHQQISSLYVAFGIVNSDNKQERSEKEAWKRTLLESDAAIAQENSKKQEEMTQQDSAYPGQPKPELRARRSLRLLNPLPTAHHAHPVPLQAVRPAAHSPITKGLLLLLLDKDGRQALQPPTTGEEPRRKSLSRRLLPSSSQRRHINSTTSHLKFKRQYCVLHGANGLYQIRYGDSYDGPVSGVHEFLTVGISSIEHTPRSSSQAFGFEIMINANDSDAPSLCCAAESEDDFLMWMSALTSVIDGSIENQQASSLIVSPTI